MVELRVVQLGSLLLAFVAAVYVGVAVAHLGRARGGARHRAGDGFLRGRGAGDDGLGTGGGPAAARPGLGGARRGRHGPLAAALLPAVAATPWYPRRRRHVRRDRRRAMLRSAAAALSRAVAAAVPAPHEDNPMEPIADRAFLDIARTRLAVHLTGQVRTCLEVLNDQQIWWRANESSNSDSGTWSCTASARPVTTSVTSVGDRDFARDRDAEFAERREIPAAELRARLDLAAAEADEVLAEFDPARLLEETDRTSGAVDLPARDRHAARPLRDPHRTDRLRHEDAQGRRPRRRLEADPGALRTRVRCRDPSRSLALVGGSARCDGSGRCRAS